MPPSTSPLPMRPRMRWRRSPNRPHQLASMASRSAGCARIAGVHSTVWILAIRAALTTRATSNSRWSDQDGYSCPRRSQIALCSSAKSVCIRPRPIHQLSAKPVIAMPVFGSVGRRPLSILSLPPSNARTASSCFRSLPYRAEPSHQCDSSFTKVGGCPASSADRVGSGGVRRIRIGFSNQSSLSSSGMLSSSPGRGSPWLNQSCAWNCSQAAASRLRVGAG